MSDDQCNAESKCEQPSKGSDNKCIDESKGDPCDPDFAGGDAQEKYRELCRRTKECCELKKRLDECNERVNSREKTEEKCTEEVIDWFHCVDSCAAPKFFKYLK